MRGILKSVLLWGLCSSLTLLKGQSSSPESMLREGSIASLEIQNKSDPRALDLLRKVEKKAFENSPESLEGYRFTQYEKMRFDLHPDSVQSFNRSTRALTLEKATRTQPSKKQRDSLRALELLSLNRSSALFLFERAQEFTYSKGAGLKSRVLDSRIAGLKDPPYALLALRGETQGLAKELQSESFPIYRYFLSDTIQTEGREYWVVRFREVKKNRPSGSRRYSGSVWIDSSTLGVRRIESQGTGPFEASKVRDYRLVSGKWFLQHESLRFESERFSTMLAQTAGLGSTDFARYFTLESYYSDFYAGPVSLPRQMYELSVDSPSQDALALYRQEELSSREEATYRVLDSVGRGKQWQGKANFLGTLLKGRIQLGPVDILADRLLGLNQVEGVRTGMGIELNEHFHPRFRPSGYLAYGWKDQRLKYGLEMKYRTSKMWHSILGIYYKDDVKAAGRFSETLWNFRMKLLNAGVNLKNPRFYSYQGGGVFYEYDVSSDLSFRLEADHYREEALFPYTFNRLEGPLRNTQLSFTAHYAPFNRSVMTPQGKYTYQYQLPEVFFNFSQGLKAMDGAHRYSKIQLLANHQLKSALGESHIRIYGGLVSGSVPIWHQFEMNGLAGSDPGLHFNLTSYLGFATMPAGVYYSSKMAGTYLSHELPFTFKSLGSHYSSFNVVYRAAIGSSIDPTIHQLAFRSLEKPYQEVGLEWNNFLSTRFNLGAFYRVGHYQTNTFKENFALQLKFSLLGF